VGVARRRQIARAARRWLSHAWRIEKRGHRFQAEVQPGQNGVGRHAPAGWPMNRAGENKSCTVAGARVAVAHEYWRAGIVALLYLSNSRWR